MTQGLYIWSKVAATNGAVDSSINMAEGMSPSAVNDGCRAIMARTAEYRDDSAGSLTTGGSSTAFTLATNQVFDSLAHLSGQRLKVRFNAASGASPTLNVDGLGAKALQNASGTAVTTGQIAANSLWDVTYDNSIPAFLLSGVPGVVPAGTANAASVAFAAGSKLLGSSDSGAGNGQEITLGSGLQLSGTTLTSAAPPAASFKNLSIKVATNTTVTLNADFIAVTDGTSFQTLAYNSKTIDLGTTGANALDTSTIAIDTFYFIWAIAKADGTTAGLASTSSTSPTMPSGYTFKARVGAVQTIHASATLYGTWQLGRQVQYVVGLAQTANLPIAISGISGSVSVPTYTAQSLSRFVPSTASRVRGSVGSQSGSATILTAPNSSYGNSTSITNPPPIRQVGPTGQTGSTLQFDFLLESTSIYYASDGSNSFLAVSGWEDNI